MSRPYLPPVGDRRRALGERGESLAAAFLCGLGFRITHRNLRLRSGEIDIVAYDGDLLVVVEVRTRGSHDSLGPLRSIGAEKQSRVRRNAESLMQLLGVARTDPVRIDVVGVVLEADSASIEYVANAF